MPAYRSSAEAEIRDAVVERIRERRPNSRIIHEINVGSYGPNRIDLIAVDHAEIIAVEIKSAKDKLDRLPAQIEAMKGVAHHVIAAIHEKFLIEQPTNKWAAHYERHGQLYMRRVPDSIRSDQVWVYPEKPRIMAGADHDALARWRFPRQRIETALPSAALDMLWSKELQELCGALRVSVGKRPTMPWMSSALRWNCTGKELTRGICAALRARRCVEADTEIIERIAA